jgi:hypothetical protein
MHSVSPGGSPNDQATSMAMSRNTLGLGFPLGLVSGVAGFVREGSINCSPVSSDKIEGIQVRQGLALE